MMGYMIAGLVLVTFVLSVALTVGIAWFLGSTILRGNGGAAKGA